MPTTAAYVAAKFGVVGFSETLRQELAPHGVGVSTFCPGRVVTSLIANTMKLGGHTKFPAGGGTGSDPADIGLLILEGIAQNARFILSEPDYWRTLVEDHLQAVREAFDKGGLA
jgi:short-subunit dehydrogenase